MKKKLSLALCLIISICSFNALGQKKAVAKNRPVIALKNEIDTISYAYGAGLAENLSRYLMQLGVINDTESLTNSYNSRIESETDAVQKTKLEKEFKFKLDSLNLANSKNLDVFMLGMKERLSDKQKAEYYHGISIAAQIMEMSKNMPTQFWGEGTAKKLNANLLVDAIADALRGNKPLLENPTQLVEQKIEDAAKAKNGPAIEAGRKFLEENSTKQGVVTLPSGLQYKILTEGTGPIPTADDRVKVHYRGTLTDGTVFDSSIDRGEPVDLGVSHVIKGWTEALQLMPVGSKWMLYIPSELGYGPSDQGVIKPFSTLVFEVELLSIEE